MNQNRHYVPGHTYRISRSTFQHTAFFEPDEGCRALFGYLLAHAANRWSVEVHSATLLTSRYEMTATDREGNLGAFLAAFHGLMARAMNARLGRTDSFWGSAGTDVRRICRPVDHLTEACDVMATPVEAGYVATAAEWPGFGVTPGSVGTTVTFARPTDFFFRKKGRRSMPDSIELRIHEPADAIAEFGPGAFAHRLGERLAERERQLRVERGDDFLGAETLRDLGSAPALDPPPRHDRGEVICEDEELLLAALEALAEFRRRYREAVDAMKRGENPTFPLGTFALRLYYGVKVEAAPPRRPAKSGRLAA